MDKTYLAKDNETIQKHTDTLLHEYNRFKKSYGAALTEKEFLILKFACIYHDLGKANGIFQEKIRSKTHIDGEIPHGYLSCALIDPSSKEFEKLSEEDIRVLYETIFFHHYRGEVSKEMRNKIKSYINTFLKEDLDGFNYDKVIIPTNLNIKFIKSIKTRIIHSENLSKSLEQKYVKVKGMLNRIDYAASAHINVEQEPDDLHKLVYKSIKDFKPNEMQCFMTENNDKNIIVIASTGMGKTEGALLWIGKDKGFFTLPLKVSINAIYDRIVNNIGYTRDKTGLLHSDTVTEYLRREVYNEDYLYSTKQLTLPLTVCTLDQLITFIFKFHNFEVFLATLSYSKIIIDEIQTHSPSMVGYLLIAIRSIDYYKGMFAIVTATFPPIFEYFMEYCKITNYTKPKQEFLIDKIRHKMKVIEKELTSQDIVNAYDNNRVLVIVNTVKKAQQLYFELTKNKDFKVHLFHAKFTKNDRAKKESSIFKDGNRASSKKVIWITTQVVEASLDIDFDVLLTELSDVNGLFQRMGRCYRGRELTDDMFNIFVFTEASGVKKAGKGIIDSDIYNHSKTAILNYNNQSITEKLKMKIIEEVYSVENLKESNYFKEIKNTIDNFKDVKSFDLQKNEARLRDISSVTIIPRSLYTNEITDKILSYKKEKDTVKKLEIKESILGNTISVEKHFINKNTEYFKFNNFEEIYIIDNEYNYEFGLLKDKVMLSNSI